MKLSAEDEKELDRLVARVAPRLDAEGYVPERDPEYVRASHLLERGLLFGRESAKPRAFNGLSPRLNK